jgi:hypothetical protein
MNPDIKLIFVMRDPIDRTWSSVLNTLKKNAKGSPITLDAALAKARSRSVESRSAYTETLNRLESVFSKDQLHYCFFEHLRDEPIVFVAKILSFLGVETTNIRKLVREGAQNVVGALKPVPIEFSREIARDYLPSVWELCRRFDGPPHAWRARCEQLLSGR